MSSWPYLIQAEESWVETLMLDISDYTLKVISGACWTLVPLTGQDIGVLILHDDDG